MNRRIGAVLILALLLSFGLFSTALAHAKLVSSDPAAGAKLTAAPSKITLVFSEEISDKATDSNFTVTDGQGVVVGNGQLDTTDLDHKTLSGTLKAGAGDGVYTVKWSAVTPDDDGHSSGSFTFGVNKDPGAQPTAQPEPTEAPEATAAPVSTATAQPLISPAPGSQTPNLPRTGDSGTDASPYLLAGALIALFGGLALRRMRSRAR